MLLLVPLLLLMLWPCLLPLLLLLLLLLMLRPCLLPLLLRPCLLPPLLRSCLAAPPAVASAWEDALALAREQVGLLVVPGRLFGQWPWP